ncbi:hypothetical protein HB762_27210 (plasmid) [Vibrio campbellii]|uniref:Aldehyde-activating protein n=1 Tax=Vibrio campbellii TaxID=680 RepID=A0ABY5IL47_9VIBR|nr:hypothetical protein [Vibrio campbellii]UTZ34955.1 hypothetical protein HB762_27210 [Vibrio campbellii]
MAIHLVPGSSSIDMIGPYLAAKAVCPCCDTQNVFVRVEGPTSPVKPVTVCSHIRAHVIDDDGLSNFEFED